MPNLLAPKQMDFILDSTKKINIAHGSVRSGKTVATLFRFMQAVESCPDSQIWMIGHSSSTIYHNAVRLLMEANTPNNPLSIFQPFLTWHPGKAELKFRNKTISTVGAKDEGAIGAIQGKTFSLAYCDEITLYPESIIDMIHTRLSNPHSKLFCSCNPSHPTHKIKQWIDKAIAGDPLYYELKFVLDDNPYVDEEYKRMVRESLSGLFYKRNYLGMWCLAEGAIFDFFDRKLHVVKKPPRCAEYWVAGIDYGVTNNFACVLIGVNTGHTTQQGVIRWVEKEYVWDSGKEGRQKTNAEYAKDIEEFLAPYSIRGVYIDPSAASFKVELRKKGIATIDADNDVLSGITHMTSEMAQGNLFVCQECTSLIEEIEQYVWDKKKADKGEDAPLKQNDHCLDALRYSIISHKPAKYQPYLHNPNKYINDRFRSNF
ncbi:MAG TPA: PBSX family phage terminase large subunit [Bacteroidia bacterium]|nr:PBSX family phage terminase large subunit [Bacteroidia bacterium]